MKLSSIGLMGLPTLSIAIAMPGLAVVDSSVNSNFSVRNTAHSNKRGLSYNDAGLTHLFSGSKVAWMYNWAQRSGGGDSSYEYIPMLHHEEDVFTKNWFPNADKALASGSSHIFSWNEPDQCGNGGGCMQDPWWAVNAYYHWIQPYHGKAKLGAPAVTNGVLDSRTGKPMGLLWLKKFLSYCKYCTIDFINVHWYDSATNIKYFKKHLQDAYEVGGHRPVWVTEFGPSGTEVEIQHFLDEVIPWMDGQPWIERYAMQMCAPGQLVKPSGDGPSAIGKKYAYM